MTLMSEGDNYGTHRRCTATCHNAKKPECDCICGGRYHGKALVPGVLDAAIKQFTEEVLGQRGLEGLRDR